jgi:putative ABC transport system permease protein
MDNIFGLEMSLLLVVMLTLLAVSFVTVLYIFLRNRIMFFIGVRNIPRRVAQTVLVILGLMLSTLIISAAFTTGDTVDHSITLEIRQTLGHVDELIEFESDGDRPTSGLHIPQSEFDALAEEVADDDNIDGIAPGLVEEVTALDRNTGQSSPAAQFIGLDPASLDAFPDLEATNGNPLDLQFLADGEVFINESLADELDTETGDEITIFYNNTEHVVRVAAVAKDRGITGALAQDPEGLVTRLETLQELTGRAGQLDFIVVSNRGDEAQALAVTDEVEASLEQAFETRDLNLSIDFTKKEFLELAEEAGSAMLTFFLIFGIFSIAAGMLLIVMIFVMLAAERKSELGMARALGTKRLHLVEAFVAEGMGYNFLAALVGSALGVLVAFILVSILASLFAGSDFDLTIEPHVTPRTLSIAYSIGVVLTFITVLFSSWQVSRINIVRAIRDLPEPPAKAGWRSLALAVVLAGLGALLVLLGFASEQASPFGLGASLLGFSAAVLSRLLRIPERPAFTAVGLFLLGLWVSMAGGLFPVLDGLQGGPEMFILSGIVMVASASYVIVYNADLLLALLERVGNRFGRILPALRTAIAYPTASKFRTGMTLAMIALVVFALTMMSTMNSNFDRVFINEENFGGWDVEVRENENNPLEGGLEQALQSTSDDFDTSGFEAVGSLTTAPLGAGELCQPDTTDCSAPDNRDFFVIKGADGVFLTESRIPLQARANGFESDDAVWAALATDPTLAVIDNAAIGGDFDIGGGPDLFSLDGIAEDVKEFDAIPIEISDRETGASTGVQVIGILSLGASASTDGISGFSGLITSPETVSQVFAEAEATNFFVRLADDGDAEDVAQEIEAVLVESGAQAVSIEEERAEANAAFNSFFYLLQAFAGLGLFVGIAAVGVVAFRSVVERRQQIGMLRAIGYTRGMVALSFVLESAFTALLGVLAGMGLAILLAYFLLNSDEFSATGITSVYIPWGQIAMIGGFALGATLLMTFIPSRQAASVPIAEALRYE